MLIGGLNPTSDLVPTGTTCLSSLSVILLFFQNTESTGRAKIRRTLGMLNQGLSLGLTTPRLPVSLG